MGINLRSIAIGVRYQTRFHLVDNAGQIFDKILMQTKYFSGEEYSKVQYNNFEKVLFTDDKEDLSNYIKLTQDNTILSQKFYKDIDIDTALAEIRKKFEEVLVPTVLNEYRPPINRIGTIFNFDISDNELNAFKGKYFAAGTDIAEFRFSKSSGISQGAIYKDSGDHINRIFALSKQKDEKRISFDFQEYFKPLRPNWIDCESKVFFDMALSEVKKEILDL